MAVTTRIGVAKYKTNSLIQFYSDGKPSLTLKSTRPIPTITIGCTNTKSPILKAQKAQVGHAYVV